MRINVFKYKTNNLIRSTQNFCTLTKVYEGTFEKIVFLFIKHKLLVDLMKKNNIIMSAELIDLYTDNI